MIRTKLTAWNCLVLSLVLTATGVAIFLTTRRNLYAGVDTGLEARALFMIRRGLPDTTRGFLPPPMPPAMAPDEAMKNGIDPMQLKEFDVQSSILRPVIVGTDGVDIMFPGRQLWDRGAFLRALRGTASFGNAFEEDVPIRTYTVQIRENGRPTLIIQLAKSLQNEEDELAQLAKTLYIVFPLAVVVMLLTGVALTRLALRPVAQIASSAEKIEESSLSGRLPVNGRDEFAYLASVVNKMLERIETAFRRQEIAYASQIQFTSDASHELKTPLTAIRARVELGLKKEATPEKYREHLCAIDRASRLMASLLNDLLTLAYAQEKTLQLNIESVGVKSLVDDALASVSRGKHRITLGIPNNLAVVVDRNSMARVLINLVENAIRYSGDNAPIQINARRIGDGVELSVMDSGKGIDVDYLPFIFDRFYRIERSRDRDSGGSGLGLAIAKAIVEAHGGTISLVSSVGFGTVVTVLLPNSQ